MVDSNKTKNTEKNTKSTSVKAKVAKPKKTAQNKEIKNKSVAKQEKQAANAELNFAIVKKGNMQYYLEEGQVYEFPKFNAPEGKEYIFEEVLLLSKGGDLKIGAPTVKGAKVKIFIIKQKKGEKLHGFKYKAKSRYRKTWGYRKPVTRFRVLEILG